MRRTSQLALIAAFAASTSLVAGTALADDWDGFHFGGTAVVGNSDIDNEDRGGFLGPRSSSLDESFIGGGVFAGYDFDLGSGFVLGAGIEGNFYADGRTEPLTVGKVDAVTYEPDWTASLTARAGYAFDEAAMIYVRGGVAALGLDVSVQNDSASETEVGFTLGTGIDFKITDRLFGRAEYSYSRFQSDNTFGDAPTEGDSIPINTSLDLDADIDIHAVKIGIGYRF